MAPPDPCALLKGKSGRALVPPTVRYFGDRNVVCDNALCNLENCPSALMSGACSQHQKTSKMAKMRLERSRKRLVERVGEENVESCIEALRVSIRAHEKRPLTVYLCK